MADPGYDLASDQQTVGLRTSIGNNGLAVIYALANETLAFLHFFSLTTSRGREGLAYTDIHFCKYINALYMG